MTIVSYVRHVPKLWKLQSINDDFLYDSETGFFCYASTHQGAIQKFYQNRLKYVGYGMLLTIAHRDYLNNKKALENMTLDEFTQLVTQSGDTLVVKELFVIE